MAEAQKDPYNERDAGLLLVFSDPGKDATLDEFHGAFWEHPRPSGLLYETDRTDHHT